MQTVSCTRPGTRGSFDLVLERPQRSGTSIPTSPGPALPRPAPCRLGLRLTSAPYAGQGYPAPLAAPMAPLSSRIFMTSINYPGVYGRYYYGPGSSMAPIVSPYVDDLGQRARIEVRVAADADLWINVVKREDHGAIRRIVSPPLVSRPAVFL